MDWLCATHKKKHTQTKRDLYFFFICAKYFNSSGNVGILLSSYPITKTHIECSTTEIAMRFMEYNPSATYHITDGFLCFDGIDLTPWQRTNYRISIDQHQGTLHRIRKSKRTFYSPFCR